MNDIICCINSAEDNKIIIIHLLRDSIVWGCYASIIRTRQKRLRYGYHTLFLVYYSDINEANSYISLSKVNTSVNIAFYSERGFLSENLFLF